MWFDSHCHLHLCAEKEPVDHLLHRAHEAGVLELVSVGIDLGSSRLEAEIAGKYQTWSSAGVHPNSASAWSDDVAAEIDALLENERVVGVGETGLDFYRDDVSPHQQRPAFAAHIELAKKHDKALIIHTRDSIDATLEMLADLGPPRRLVFHCWSGEEVHLRDALDLGAHISFAGNVSFANADDLRHLAALVPDDRLLVETDSPFLTPVPHRGKPNEPRNVPFVGVALARAREVSAHLIAEQTSDNARALFGIPQ